MLWIYQAKNVYAKKMSRHRQVNYKPSIRQLASGEMENIRKRFENVAEGSNTKPPVSPKKVPRPITSALKNTDQNGQEFIRKRTDIVSDGNKPTISPKRVLPNVTPNSPANESNEELKSIREQILQKRRPSSEFQSSSGINAAHNVSLRNVSSDNDLTMTVQRTIASRVTPPRPVSVAERTKLFENKVVQEETPVKIRERPLSSSSDGGNEDKNEIKQTPTAKPRSRPVSSSNDVDIKDEKSTPRIKPRSRPSSQAQDDDENVSYGALWDAGQKVTSPAPLKPPRTGAHDDYMKIKMLNIKETQNLDPTEKSASRHHYETVPDDLIQNTPVYRRINKSEIETGDDSSKRPPKPTRPPPPKDTSRPVTIASKLPQKSYSFSEKEKPIVSKRPPSGENNSPLYEELDTQKNKLDIGKIKHWDLPNDELLESNLKRSFSAECLSRDSLFDDPIYVDPIKVNFRDDTEFDVYIDPSGYAIPYRHNRLKQTASTPVEMKPIGQAVKCKLGNLRRRIFHPDNSNSKEKKEFDLAKNKKKLQSVKMKINIAFAIMRKGKKTDEEHDEGQSSDTGSIESDSLVDEKEIEKRKDYCTVVRRNTAKRKKDNKQVQSVVYPQLFDFALIVGLEPIPDEGGYRPYIIYKFPEQYTGTTPGQIDCNISIPQFCFPDAGEFDVKTASPAAPSESFSFVLTNVDGQHVYGYCKRLVPIDTPAGLPEVICIVSPVDAFSMYNDLLDEIEMKRQVSMTMAKELIVAAFGRPMPEPGKMVHVRTLDENWETGTIFLARPSDDRVDNVNRETLLSKLGVDKIIKLFSVMLLERSILFCAKNLGILSQTIHAMRSLLYPFSWPHTYIPVLPDTMLDICCSPTPFVIGILSSHLQKVLNLPLSEIFIFDLDKRQVVKSHGDEDTLLPKSVQKALKTVLNMCKVEGDLKNAQNLLISEAFLRFFVEAVGHYANHITTQQNGQVVFEKESFVKNAQSSSMEQFLEWFTETQMFEVFLAEKVETTNKAKSNTLNIFNSRIKEYNDELEESKKEKKKSKGFLKLLK